MSGIRDQIEEAEKLSNDELLDAVEASGASMTISNMQEITRFKKKLAKGKNPGCPKGMSAEHIVLHDRIEGDTVGTPAQARIHDLHERRKRVQPTSHELFGYVIAALLSGFFCWLFTKLWG